MLRDNYKDFNPDYEVFYDQGEQMILSKVSKKIDSFFL